MSNLSASRTMLYSNCPNVSVQGCCSCVSQRLSLDLLLCLPELYQWLDTIGLSPRTAICWVWVSTWLMQGWCNWHVPSSNPNEMSWHMLGIWKLGHPEKLPVLECEFFKLVSVWGLEKLGPFSSVVKARWQKEQGAVFSEPRHLLLPWSKLVLYLVFSSVFSASRHFLLPWAKGEILNKTTCGWTATSLL